MTRLWYLAGFIAFSVAAAGATVSAQLVLALAAIMCVVGLVREHDLQIHRAVFVLGAVGSALSLQYTVSSAGVATTVVLALGMTATIGWCYIKAPRPHVTS